MRTEDVILVQGFLEAASNSEPIHKPRDVYFNTGSTWNKDEKKVSNRLKDREWELIEKYLKVSYDKGRQNTINGRY